VVLLHYPKAYRGQEENIGVDIMDPIERSFVHERVHVLQLDQAFLLFTAPAEDWLMDRTRTTARIHRWVDPGVLTAALYLPELLVPYNRRPWEREADFLARLPN
jgi:methyl coenzyme M reductase gamma subunit